MRLKLFLAKLLIFPFVVGVILLLSPLILIGEMSDLWNKLWEDYN